MDDLVDKPEADRPFADLVHESVCALVSGMCTAATDANHDDPIGDAMAGLFAACTHFTVRFTKSEVTDEEIVDMMGRYARDFIPQVRAHLASEAMGEPGGQA